MKRQIYILPFITAILFSQSALATIYECTYKTKNNATIVASFNPFFVNKPNYKELYIAYKKGDCEELFVKKYFIQGTNCNIQFYKKNGKIGNLVCNNNNKNALEDLKKIAKKDFGYSE